MLEFFAAVSRAFARNRESSEHFAYFLAGLVALAAGWLVVAALRQRRTTALRFDDFVHQRGLGDADAELSRELARAARVDAMELVTHLDAGATTLASIPPSDNSSRRRVSTKIPCPGRTSLG